MPFVTTTVNRVLLLCIRSDSVQNGSSLASAMTRGYWLTVLHSIIFCVCFHLSLWDLVRFYMVMLQLRSKACLLLLVIRDSR